VPLHLILCCWQTETITVLSGAWSGTLTSSWLPREITCTASLPGADGAVPPGCDKGGVVGAGTAWGEDCACEATGAIPSRHAIATRMERETVMRISLRGKCTAARCELQIRPGTKSRGTNSRNYEFLAATSFR